MYCFKYHEHVGKEAAQCWATPDETSKYWKRKVGDSAGMLNKGDNSGDELEAEMTDNSSVDDSDDESVTDDGIPDLDRSFNAWDSVEPASESEDESFNDDGGYGDESEDDGDGGAKSDEDDNDGVQEEAFEKAEVKNDMSMWADICLSNEALEAAARKEEEDWEKYEDRKTMRMFFGYPPEYDENFMEGIERTTEETKQDASETAPLGKTCKEVLGQELWDFPTELDAETMDKLASPNKVPGEGDIAERYKAAW
ncbi:hypothetical protein HDK64DRAFT_282179 [Phyllosticta capitalensis]